MKDLKATIQITEIIREQPNGSYSAFCKELGLATCGKSFNEAQRRLHKATLLVLNSAIKREEIEQLLDEKDIPITESFEYDTPRLYNFCMTPNEWARPSFHNVKVGA